MNHIRFFVIVVLFTVALLLLIANEQCWLLGDIPATRSSYVTQEQLQAALERLQTNILTDFDRVTANVTTAGPRAWHERAHVEELHEESARTMTELSTQHDGIRTMSGCLCLPKWKYRGIEYEGCTTTKDNPKKIWCYINVTAKCSISAPFKPRYDICSDGPKQPYDIRAQLLRELDFWFKVKLPQSTPLLEVRRAHRHHQALQRALRAPGIANASARFFERDPVPAQCNLQAALTYHMKLEDGGADGDNRMGEVERKRRARRQIGLNFHLARLAEAVRENGMPAIIALGTALAFTRECGAIPGDPDGDFLIPRSFLPDQATFDIFVAGLRRSGYYAHTTYGAPGSTGWQFSVEPVKEEFPKRDNTKPWAYFDFFIIDEDFTTGGCVNHPCRWVHYINTGEGQTRRCVSHPMSLQLVAWLGTTFWAPWPMHGYLVDEYGEHWSMRPGSKIEGGKKSKWPVYQNCHRRGSGLPEWTIVVDREAPEEMRRVNTLSLPSPASVVELQTALEEKHHGAIQRAHEDERKFLVAVGMRESAEKTDAQATLRNAMRLLRLLERERDE